MGRNLAETIMASHLVSGRLVPGEEVGISIDQTLTQDATGTLAYLELEAMKVQNVATELSVSYVDHNTLQTGFQNADDHRYLRTVAAKYGIYFSPPGNGISHQVHLERFGIPGKTLLGSDSHTPTAGGLGMLAVGAGGIDVAAAMAGTPFFLTMPHVVKITLDGSLPSWVAAKDIILEVLRRLTVNGGVGKILEYGGPGLHTLTVPERSTIANMGAETGATSSIFPSDARTREYLRLQGRENQWHELVADEKARYTEIIHVDLTALTPLLATPHSPDHVRPVQEMMETPVHQVVIGSCTNSSFEDMAKAALVLRGKRVHPKIDLIIAPASRQVLHFLAEHGYLQDFIAAGARLLEPACGPCIGMGQSPPTGGVTLRTFNRNFKGRGGTADALIFLCSSETAAASALAGEIMDPREMGAPPQPNPVTHLWSGESLILPAECPREETTVVRGPNIKPLPDFPPLPDTLRGQVLLKLGDNITTDDILPAGNSILALRSNIPAIAEFAYSHIDPTFFDRATRIGGGVIVGGRNYGQGSSREHAALVPRYLGVAAVVAKSFARIHHANLVNFGVVPLVFSSEPDYDRIDQEDEISIFVNGLSGAITLRNETKQITIPLRHDLGARQREIVKAGGLLNAIRMRS